MRLWTACCCRLLGAFLILSAFLSASVEGVFDSRLHTDTRQVLQKSGQLSLQPSTVPQQHSTPHRYSILAPSTTSLLPSLADDSASSAGTSETKVDGRSSLSALYHQRVFGISIGTTVLMFSVLGLLAFVLYAKHRSSMVYRATEDYENAYDRMLSVMEAFPEFRPIFEHRQLTKFLPDDETNFAEQQEFVSRLRHTSETIHKICDECENSV